MFGSNYRPKSLGRLSAVEVAHYRDNCAFSSEAVPTSRVKGSMWRYYGPWASSVATTASWTRSSHSSPSEWVTADDVPDGLAWERRLLKPEETVPRMED